MMRFLLTLFTLAALASSVVASTVITGTLTITNAANINSTNAYTIDVNGDVRTWTNGVVTPSEQILASTNTATAALRALVHFATYPVSDLVLSGNGSTYISWRAATDAALTITLNTNTWGVVTYATNTVGVTATTVAVPYGFFGASSQTNIANGLMDWLNLAANTTSLSLDKIPSIPSSKITSLASSKVFWNHSALTAASAATNFIATFPDNGDPYRTITAVANINFLQSTNRPTGTTNVQSLVIRIDPNGTNRNLTFNSNWNFLGTKPTSLVSTNVGILSLTAFGSAETDVWAA
jgi:hypothetical protein